MSYNRIDELPNKIRFNLPKNAQEIFMRAFNSAWEQNKKIEKNKSLDSIEKIANMEALSAVKKNYDIDINIW